jgi:hypothetical protein
VALLLCDFPAGPGAWGARGAKNRGAAWRKCGTGWAARAAWKYSKLRKPRSRRALVQMSHRASRATRAARQWCCCVLSAGIFSVSAKSACPCATRRSVLAWALLYPLFTVTLTGPVVTSDYCRRGMFTRRHTPRPPHPVPSTGPVSAQPADVVYLSGYSIVSLQSRVPRSHLTRARTFAHTSRLPWYQTQL